MIEEKQVQRLGGRKLIKLDIRFVAATNRDLDTLATEDKFRKDLYFRLNVGRIHLPPLRHRKRDIPILIDHYVRELNQEFGATVEGVEPEHLHWGEVGRAPEEIVTAGLYGWTAVVTGTGATVREAQAAAYARARRVQTPNLRYRLDIGAKLIAGDLRRVTEAGWFSSNF